MKEYLNLVKFSHTVFAMPFALTGFFMGTQMLGDQLSWFKLALVIGCMVTARNTAMAFNRYIDRDIDGKNNRTAVREIPSGILSANKVIVFVLLNALFFVTFTYLINPICFYLSPVALLVIVGYSLTKRFTFLCHLILGLGLSLAPVGAFLAVTAYFHVLPILLGFAVLSWVAGFDVIYALQDEEFDRSNGLFSIPAYFGRKKSLLISRALHLISGSLLVFTIYYAHQFFSELGFLSYLGIMIFLAMLAFQHSLVKENDLSRVNLAFFTTNGIASIIFGMLFCIDLLVL
ncbi:MAG: UbiA family prenyltransferase [Saprospiraceae bacterium]|nr:UbiA family prenyltransferase [Saprospiraceae bacterium]